MKTSSAGIVPSPRTIRKTFAVLSRPRHILCRCAIRMTAALLGPRAPEAAVIVGNRKKTKSRRRRHLPLDAVNQAWRTAGHRSRLPLRLVCAISNAGPTICIALGDPCLRIAADFIGIPAGGVRGAGPWAQDHSDLNVSAASSAPTTQPPIVERLLRFDECARASPFEGGQKLGEPAPGNSLDALQRAMIDVAVLLPATRNRDLDLDRRNRVVPCGWVEQAR